MRKLLVILVVLTVAAALIAIGGILLSASPRGTGRPAILTLTLRQSLPDYSPLARLPLLGQRVPTGLATLHRVFTQARQDPSVKGVAVYIQNARFGLAKAQELRRLLRSFEDEGKFVECYLETAGEGQNGTLAYYLATACSEISLAPAGDLNLVGLLADATFFRGTLDRLKIDPDFTQVGDYKGSGEVYTEYQLSPEARETLDTLLDDFHSDIVDVVAEARDLTDAEVRRLIDGAPYDAGQALALGLVDHLSYPDEFRQRLRDRFGEEPRLVTALEYADRARGRGDRRLAVVFVQGTLVRGHGGVDPWSGELSAGSDDLDELFQRLLDDPEVAAVILRIDSPGGSAQASDLILRQVSRLAEQKPIVVSMSDLAASGGYYIAARAHRILAHESTLTGSIGVVGGKLATRRFQQELLGVSHDTLKRGENADFYSLLDPFSEAQRERYRELMERTYDTFVGHVAGGREMTRDQVLDLAGGRVWSGSRAVELGLVDEIGGLERALAVARELGGLAPGEAPLPRFYPEPPTLVDILLEPRSIPFPLGRLRLEELLLPPADHSLELPLELRRLAEPF